MSLRITHFDSYQELAQRTAATLSDDKHPILVAALGLTGEAGEAAEIVKKWYGHDHELDRVALKKELGDVLWYVGAMASINGWSLSEIATDNIDKLAARYPEGFTTERSQMRCRCGHHHDDHADDTVFLRGNEGSSITTFACTQCPCGDYDGPDGGSA